MAQLLHRLESDQSSVSKYQPGTRVRSEFISKPGIAGIAELSRGSSVGDVINASQTSNFDAPLVNIV